MLVHLEFSQQIFKKSPSIKFHKISSNWNHVIRAYGQTDEQTESRDKAKSPLHQFITNSCTGYNW